MSIDYRFVLPGPTAEVARRQVERDMDRARLSPGARLYYAVARPLLPVALRQKLQRGARPRLDESWYLPDDDLRAWCESLAHRRPLPVVHPWPGGAPLAFVLTHDVESAEGLRASLALAGVEEDLGLRSSFNLVPYKYPIDPGIVGELEARGFEIGIHGYNHDGRLYVSRRVFQQRAAAINAALRAYGAVGFRSPMVHRNLQWLQQLEIEYDCSCFDVDPIQPMPGGVGSLWPLVAGRFVELPYTLPQDHSLWIVLGESDNRTWEGKLHYVARRQGMALMLTHPDYMTPFRIALYRDFLAHVKHGAGAWHALPRDVARWWRQRDASELRGGAGGAWQIVGPAAGRARPAEVCVEENTLTFRLLAVPEASPLEASR